MKKSQTIGNLDAQLLKPVFIIGDPLEKGAVLAKVMAHFLDIEWFSIGKSITRLLRRLPEFGNLHHLPNQKRLIAAFNADRAVRHWQRRYGSRVVEAEILDGLEKPVFQSMVKQILRRPSRGAGCMLWGSVLGNALDDARALNEIFPQSRFIHVIRDGRDVAMAHFRRPKGIKNWALAGLKWKHNHTCVAQFGSCLPAARFLEIRYEDFPVHPQEMIGKLADFLEIRHTPFQVPSNELPSWEIDIPLEQPFLWKEKCLQGDVVMFEKVAGEMLRRYGYEVDRQPAKGDPADVVVCAGG